MKNRHISPSQRGVALVVALLFLLVVTVISVIAASNSAIGLKMSANMADSYSSFQSAEAGILAVLSLTGTAHDPFSGRDEMDPFAGISPHPLDDLNDGAGSVNAEVFLTHAASACPRSPSGSSVGLFDCEYYRIASEHSVPKKARTRAELGVVKTIIGGSGP